MPVRGIYREADEKNRRARPNCAKADDAATADLIPNTKVCGKAWRAVKNMILFLRGGEKCFARDRCQSFRGRASEMMGVWIGRLNSPTNPFEFIHRCAYITTKHGHSKL